jgi:hypothetical protein
MKGYTEERLASKEDVYLPKRELRDQLSLEVALTMIGDLKAEVNSLYHHTAHKELYDCIMMINGVKKQLNKIQNEK